MYYLLGLNSLYFDQGKISIGINYADIGVNYTLKVLWDGSWFRAVAISILNPSY